MDNFIRVGDNTSVGTDGLVINIAQKDTETGEVVHVTLTAKELNNIIHFARAPWAFGTASL